MSRNTSLILALAVACGIGAPTSAADERGEPGPVLVRDLDARKKASRSVSNRSKKAVRSALAWLVAHQEDNGSWDCDGFDKHDSSRDPSGGPGDDLHDIGVTGLSLLAIMAGSDLRPSKRETKALEWGLEWLVEQQNTESGLIGADIGHHFLYGHAIATLTLCEAIVVLGRDELRAPAVKAVGCILAAQAPRGGWRYELPSAGDSDTSVTVWMLAALRAARDAGVSVDETAFDDAAIWISHATDRETGRVGYDDTGTRSARVQNINEHYSVEHGEAMTAAGLFCRYLLGQDGHASPVMEEQVTRILKKLPAWNLAGADEKNPDGLSCDMYYWYYGSLALHQVGGREFDAWSKALEKAVIGEQVRSGSAKGSWDPVGAWGYAGGRVYATAILALALATPARYARVMER